MSKAADHLWAEALKELPTRMDRLTFQRLLQGSRVVDAGEGTLTIGVVTRGAELWLERRLRGVVEQVLKLVAGRPIAVSFVAGSPPLEEREDDEEERRQEGGGLERRPIAAHSITRSPPREEEEGDEAEQEGDEAVAAEPAPRERSAPGKKLAPGHYYIRIRTAFREQGVRKLMGPPLSTFLILAMHTNGDNVAAPGIEAIMRETGYSRRAVCSALAKLENLGLITRRGTRHRATAYKVNAYAWFGSGEAPALWED